MKKLTNSLRIKGLQSQKSRLCYYVEEAFQQSLGDPLLCKLDCKLR